MHSSTSISSPRAHPGGHPRHSLWLLPLEILLLVVSLHLIDEVLADVLSQARPPDYVAFVDSREGFDPARDYDVIAVGDSYIADAFVPKAFQAETGLTGFNFGVYNSSPFEWYYLVQDLIERGARPRYVLIGTNPRMFGQPASVGVHTLDFIRSPRVRMKMFWAAPGSDSLFKAVRHRYLLNTVIKRITGGQMPMPARRIVAVDNGYLENVSSMSAAEAAADEDYAPIRPIDASGDQIQMLERLLELLDRHGIVPIFVDTPVHHALLDAMERHPDYRAFRRILSTMAARHEAPIFHGRMPQYVNTLQATDFLNKGHLRASGAKQFSSDLGAWFAPQHRVLSSRLDPRHGGPRPATRASTGEPIPRKAD